MSTAVRQHAQVIRNPQAFFGRNDRRSRFCRENGGALTSNNRSGKKSFRLIKRHPRHSALDEIQDG